MRPWALLSVMTLSMTIFGCSADDGAAPSLASHACTCGEPETDVLGCPAQCCVDEDAACANHHCTCPGDHTAPASAEGAEKVPS